VRKLVSKTRTGARVTRRYDAARTPYHRLRDSGVLAAQTARELKVRPANIDPYRLKVHLEAAQRTLAARAARSDSYVRVRPDEGACIQRVRFPRRQGLASQRESSLALCKVTNMAKRRQSDRQAPTQVKRLSLVREIEQMPTDSSFGKAPVDAGYGDGVGESAGVGERGMPRDGCMAQLGKPIEVSRGE